MNQREDSPEVKKIASDVLGYLRERPGQEVTYAGLAGAVTSDGSHMKTNFRMAMRRARCEALARGGQITSRQWSSELGAYTVSYLPVLPPDVRSEPEALNDLYVQLRRISEDAAGLHSVLRTVPAERVTAPLLTQAMSSLDEALNTAVMAADLAFQESEQLRERRPVEGAGDGLSAGHRAAYPEAGDPVAAPELASVS